MRTRGFTLIELLIALAIIGLLLSIVTPRFFGGVAKAEESALRENLSQIRDALDKHYADTERYPGSLGELVSKRYMRAIPVDPVTQSADTWIPVAHQDTRQGAVADVKSGAKGVGRNGIPYEQW